MKLTIVTTIYRSADCIAEFCERAFQAARALDLQPEIILVNDASPDNGFAVATQIASAHPEIVVIDLARNVGQHRALWVGLKHATGDLVAILDGDLDDDPLWLFDFHRQLSHNNADVVYGVMSDKRGGPLYALGRRIFYWMYDAISTHAAPRNMVTARLMTRRYLDALLQYDERELSLIGVMTAVGFRQIGMPVEKGVDSPSTYNFWRLCGVFVRGVTAFSIVPLMAVFVAGVVVCATSLVFIAWLVAVRLFGGPVSDGWTSVIASVLLMGGLILFFNGIIAIYVGTIFLEVKRRPPAIVRQIVGRRQ